MAQKRPIASESAKPNKFKFVYIEADLSETNFSELTSTIAQVMRPPSSPKQIANGRPPAAIQSEHDSNETADVTEAEFEEVPSEPTPTADSQKPLKAPRAARKTKPPEYLPDLLTDREAFKGFAKEKSPTSRNKQYLVAAYWLKEFGNVPTVNADKVYTCFKTAGWPIGFNDWRQPFDNLVHTEHVRKVAPGEFAINPLGEDAVTTGKD